MSTHRELRRVNCVVHRTLRRLDECNQELDKNLNCDIAAPEALLAQLRAKGAVKLGDLLKLSVPDYADLYNFGVVAWVKLERQVAERSVNMPCAFSEVEQEKERRKTVKKRARLSLSAQLPEGVGGSGEVQL